MIEYWEEKIESLRSTGLDGFRRERNNPFNNSELFRYTDNLVALHFKYDFWHMTATAGSDVVQSGRPIFDDLFQHLWPYIGNNTANVVFQMVKRLLLIRIDQ
ncbi:adhesion G protein-coupled receptor B2 [Trichonephila clavipes]|nr:adhesion G protein-coupled receptor B2 [Trichonephila clavipes]